jgi:hypothetical protein
MGKMMDVIMLVCASIGSLAFGILSAYGALRTSFALMRPQAKPLAIKARAEAARV